MESIDIDFILSRTMNCHCELRIGIEIDNIFRAI